MQCFHRGLSAIWSHHHAADSSSPSPPLRSCRAALDRRNPSLSTTRSLSGRGWRRREARQHVVLTQFAGSWYRLVGHCDCSSGSRSRSIERDRRVDAPALWLDWAGERSSASRPLATKPGVAPRSLAGERVYRCSPDSAPQPGRAARRLRRRRSRARLARPHPPRPAADSRGPAARPGADARDDRRRRLHARARARRRAARRRRRGLLARRGARSSRRSASTTSKAICCRRFSPPTRPSFPFVALLVSGGHTQLLEVTRRRRATRCSATRSTTPPARRSTSRPSCSASAIPAGRRWRGSPSSAIPRPMRLPRPLLQRDSLDFSFAGPEDRRAHPRAHARGRELRAAARRSRRLDAGGDRRRAGPQEIDGRAAAHRPATASSSPAASARTRCCARACARMREAPGPGVTSRSWRSAPTTAR